MTERLHFHFSLSCIGEGNGNPLQCSCLENPRDGGVWWAAISGVTQSQTQLKRLSSSIYITIPKNKKCKKAKWLSEEALQIAENRREAKSKGEKERYTHLNAELQRITRRDTSFTFISGTLINRDNVQISTGHLRSVSERSSSYLPHPANCYFYILAAAAAAKSFQSCPTLCDPTDGSPPGSPVPGILQARILEWVAISFSSA